MPRRVSAYNSELHTLNVFVSSAAFFLGVGLQIFLVNLIWSVVFKSARTEANPWQSLSLEWQLPSPVPVHNFDRIPIINSDPYGYQLSRRAGCRRSFGPHVIAGEAGAT